MVLGCFVDLLLFLNEPRAVFDWEEEPYKAKLLELFLKNDYKNEDRQSDDGNNATDYEGGREINKSYVVLSNFVDSESDKSVSYLKGIN